MHTGRIITLLLTLLCISGVANAGKLYKWTDEAGNVHYTQVPPTEEDRKVVEPVEEPAAAAPPAPPEPAPEAVDEASRQHAERCQGLYDQQQRYQSSAPLHDEQGKSLVISDEMRALKLQQISDELDQNCR